MATAKADAKIIELVSIDGDHYAVDTPELRAHRRRRAARRRELRPKLAKVRAGDLVEIRVQARDKINLSPVWVQVSAVEAGYRQADRGDDAGYVETPLLFHGVVYQVPEWFEMDLSVGDVVKVSPQLVWDVSFAMRYPTANE